MKAGNNKKILMLASRGQSTDILYQVLNREYEVIQVILEEHESKKVFLKRRIRKLGLMQVAGQVLFQMLIVPLLRAMSSSTTDEILAKSGLSETAIPIEMIREVSSINNPEVAELIASTQPDVIIVNGTRIISKRILSTIKCPVINMHAGITPKYRGVHGAYWALVNKDLEHCGVTVHLVDAGVDTGDVLYQATIQVDKNDNFTTYPLKQLAKGIPLMMTAVENVFNGEVKAFSPPGKSAQWYHPTIWQYLYYRFSRGIK